MEMLNKRLYYDTNRHEFYLVNHKLKIYMRISTYNDTYHMLCLVMAYGDWNYFKEHILLDYQRVDNLIAFATDTTVTLKEKPKKVMNVSKPKTIDELVKYLTPGTQLKLVEFKGIEMDKLETVELNSSKMVLLFDSPVMLAMDNERIHFTNNGFEVIAKGDDLISHPLIPLLIKIYDDDEFGKYGVIAEYEYVLEEDVTVKESLMI